MSPPSPATAGRTRVSIRSLMRATVSESFSSKNSSETGVGWAPVASNGAPLMKCSMMAPRIAGLICCQSPAVLVTEIKSAPKKTPVIFGISNNRSASGDCAAASLLCMSSVPDSRTGRPGRNFKVAGLGVASVWINMQLAPETGSRPVRTDQPIDGAFVRRRQLWEHVTAELELRHGVEVFIAEVPWHDRHRDRIGAGGFG